MYGNLVAGSRKLYGGGKLLMYGNFVAGSRKLYGGDLESAVSVMRTVASRIRALPEAFHKKEAYIQVTRFSVYSRCGSRTSRDLRWTPPTQESK